MYNYSVLRCTGKTRFLSVNLSVQFYQGIPVGWANVDISGAPVTLSCDAVGLISPDLLHTLTNTSYIFII